MTTGNSYQLQGDAARAYEAQKVPAIFRPLAEQTLDVVALSGDERVLDVACGTGIVARLAAARAGTGARVVGVDLNAGMLEVARGCVSQQGVAPEFRVADVGALPLDDASFDVVLCQQGLQFFPERPRALGEMRRMLAPGGRIALSVWSEASPLFVAMAEAARRYVDTSLAERVLDPFSLGDGDVIAGLLAAAGFVDIDRRALVVERRMAPAAESVPREFAGSPVAAAFAALDESTRAALVADIGVALAPWASDDGLVVPQHSHLFLARAA